MSKQVILVCGFPGSGKTTLVPQLAKDHSCVVICPDDVRLALYGEAFNAVNEPAVWDFCKSMAYYHLFRNESILLDATNLTEKARKPWIKIAEEYSAMCVLYHINTEFPVCCERNNKRTRPVPQNVMDSMYQRFQPPQASEGFYLTVLPNTNKPNYWLKEKSNQ